MAAPAVSRPGRAVAKTPPAGWKTAPGVPKTAPTGLRDPPADPSALPVLGPGPRPCAQRPDGNVVGASCGTGAAGPARLQPSHGDWVNPTRARVDPKPWGTRALGVGHRSASDRTVSL